MPPRGRSCDRFAQMRNAKCGMTREARHEAEPESEEPFYLRAQDTEELPPSSSVSLWPLCGLCAKRSSPSPFIQHSMRNLFHGFPAAWQPLPAGASRLFASLPRHSAFSIQHLAFAASAALHSAFRIQHWRRSALALQRQEGLTDDRF